MPEDERSLEGRVALVTGAGRGIGRAIAIALAEAGANVVVHYHRSRDGALAVAAEARSLGVQASVVKADLGAPTGPVDTISQALADFGQLDLLVNNAGIYSSNSVDRVTLEAWDATFAINLRAVFFLSQAGAPYLREGRPGAIVNLASDGGISPQPGFPVSAPYAVSKAGVVMLTRLLAIELGPSIRVNAVAPGVIDSKMKPMPEAVRERFSALAPLQSVGTPRDVADAVVFLASDAARFITGQVLSVDGGLVVR